MSKLEDISVGTLHGIGKVKVNAYAAAGVHSLYDLLYYFPRAYENRANVVELKDTPSDGKCATILTVATEPRVANIKRGMSLLKFRAFDDSAVCEITYFNQNYLKDKFPIGSTFRFYGKVERQKNKYTMTSPAAEPYVEGIPLPPFASVYRLSEGLSQKQVAQNVADALALAGTLLEDHMPQQVRERFDLCDLYSALCEIHNPTSYESLAAAKKRLIFDEFFLFAVGLKVSGKKIERFTAPKMANTDTKPLLSLLPYSLTEAQKRTVADIARDLGGNEPMSRIVVGDVGCGKTICATAAIYIAVKNGYQAALMAPTEILANQHYNDLCPLLSRLGISCALLTGSVTAAKKKKIYAAMQAEDKDIRLDVVIGTQALLSDGAEFIAPGLVITDEQHRFGVNQRALLAEKNKHTHVLVMSATPIPRSLALVMYGDLKMSKIDEMPPGRQRVDTFLVDESYHERLDGFIRKNVDGGGQVYVVCPAVDEQENEDGELAMSDISIFGEELQTFALEQYQNTQKPTLKAAVQYADELEGRLAGYSVAFVHGKMKAADKDNVMRRFAAGEIQILVSTTVIEVGVNVPTACLMIVENAERFGLSQLHQLRGRVGRGDKKSYCVLVNGAKGGKLGDTAQQRLKTMCDCYNGFDIAEQDLKLRGPGDFLALSGNASIRQSGTLTFRLADMCQDTDLMNAAFASAHELVESDPSLSSHALLHRATERMFTMRSDIIS
ncbi:MAG: ATP-dependent DNA helicase RecG [Ruminococcaceae bacterium]|nr:ATP-dependent DNA helicase RecG [Oscillospiraceae bacterium]